MKIDHKKCLDLDTFLDAIISFSHLEKKFHFIICLQTALYIHFYSVAYSLDFLFRMGVMGVMGGGRGGTDKKMKWPVVQDYCQGMLQ